MHFSHLYTQNISSNSRKVCRAHLICQQQMSSQVTSSSSASKTWVSSVCFSMSNAALVPESFKWLHMVLRDFKAWPRVLEQTKYATDYLVWIVFLPQTVSRSTTITDCRKERKPDEPTNISRCAAGSGHDITAALHLGETEIADHDLWLVLGVEVQQVLWLERKKKRKKGVFNCFFCAFTNILVDYFWTKMENHNYIQSNILAFNATIKLSPLTSSLLWPIPSFTTTRTCPTDPQCTSCLKPLLLLLQ